MGRRAPSITVIIPTHNRVSLLRQTVRSALDQRGVDLRVLVVDDGSSDTTVAAMSSHEDPRVDVLAVPHSGHPARARNAGLSQVTTPWVAFLDDDDLWAPEKLRLQLNALAQRPGATWCAVSSIRFTSPEHRVCGADPVPAADSLFPDLLRRNTIPGGGSGVVVNTQLVRDVGGFAEDIPRSEDWDLWIRLASSGQFVGVDLPLVGYRVAGSGRASQQTERTNVAMHEWIAHRYLDLRNQHGVSGEDDLAVRRYIAQANARSGHRRAAMREYLRSGIRHRRLADIVLGTIAGIDPRLSTRIRDQRELSKLDPEWVAFGWHWLAPMLAAERHAATG